MNKILEAVAEAIEQARCPGREGPYGLYDYSRQQVDPSCYVVRDFRDRKSKDYGNAVLRTADRAFADAEYLRLTREHIALAAINAYKNATFSCGELCNDIAGDAA